MMGSSSINKVIRNSTFLGLGQVVIMLTGMIHRRIFVRFLDVEYLGYTSLFSNIFSWLGMAELGMGSIITFHLYKEIASGNHEEIGKLMTIYKWIYRLMTATVLLVGTGLIPFLPAIIKDAATSWRLLRAVYIVQLAGLTAQNLLAYRRTLFIADQKEYRCVLVDMCCSLSTQLVRVVCLVVFRRYLLDLALSTLCGVMSHYFVYRASKKEYPYLDAKKYEVTKRDIQERNLLSDTKNYLAHNIAYRLFGATDNIVISAICGIRQVGLYGNYVVLYTGVVTGLFHKLLSPIYAAVGNKVYVDSDMESQQKLFRAFDVFSVYLAYYITFGFVLFFQPAISLWLGEQFLLDENFVIAYILTIYLDIAFTIVYYYRMSFGDYRQDRNCMLLAAAVNIVLSVFLARRIGVAGVQIGTFLGSLFMIYGRIHFVKKNFLKQPTGRYLLKHAAIFGVFLAMSTFLGGPLNGLPLSAAGLLTRAAAWVTVPGVIVTLLFVKTEDFGLFKDYMKATFRTAARG